MIYMESLEPKRVIMFCITQLYKNDEVIVTTCSKEQNNVFLFAFYIYCNGICVKKIMYSDDNRLVIDTKDLVGSLYVRCFFKHVETGDIVFFDSDIIQLDRREIEVANLSVDQNLDADVTLDEVKIPIHFVKKNDAKKPRLFIFLNGAISEESQKKHYPYFNRISWSDKFNGHCLYLYDASLDLVENYTLGWYRGVKNNHLNDKYVEIIRTFIRLLEISEENLCFYGSSGGGFAALKFAESFKGATVIAINAQTNILKYVGVLAVSRFEKVFDVERSKDEIEVNVRNLQKNDTKLVIVQNIQDTNHYRDHFLPFWSKFSNAQEGWCRLGRSYALIYDHESGHGGEPAEVFEQIMGIINN